MLPGPSPRRLLCQPHANRLCLQVSHGYMLHLHPRKGCSGRPQLAPCAAIGSGARAMTIETPPEWQPPNRPEAPPSSPPEYTPPREPGLVPGSVPEYEPPETPGPSPPSPADPPLRPLPPDQDPQIPDPERDDPLRNPEKRRQETNNPPPVQPGRVLPPDDSVTGARAGPAAAAGPSSDAEQPGPSKASDRQMSEGATVDPATTSAQRPVPPPEAEVNVQSRSPRPSRTSKQKLDIWNEQYAIKDRLYFEHPGLQANPWAVITDPTGHTVHVSLSGANVLSWQDNNRSSLIHAITKVDGENTTDLGGIMIQFPQTGSPNGFVQRAGAAIHEVPADGFLRSLLFEPVHSAATPDWASVSFSARSDPTTMQVWPFPFEAMYTVSLWNNEASEDDNTTQLRCVLQILNTGDESMVFTAGLKPHLEITSPAETQILGLGGNYFIDLAEREPILGMFAPEEIRLGEHNFDFIVTNAAVTNDVVMHTGSEADSALQIITEQGFKDLSLWHPLNQFGMPEGFGENFVCLGPTTIARPVVLEPGQKWAGEMKLLERTKITDLQREAAREVGPAIGLPRDEYLASQGLTREDIARLEAEQEREDADQMEEDEYDEDYVEDEVDEDEAEAE